MSISCIIIDDEPNALSLLEGYIHGLPALSLRGKFFDALEALEFLKREKVDLIFTDINMPLLSGLDLADILPKSQRFIFTTAFAEHALMSFSYHVIDYLLKPISFKRFVQAVNKLETVTVSGTGSANTSGPQESIVFAKSGKQIVKINFTDVLYIKGEKEYVSIHFRNEKFLLYKRMKDMESLLISLPFKRVHASYIVNINYIQKIEANQIVMGNTIKIPVSENYRDSFQQFIHEKMI